MNAIIPYKNISEKDQPEEQDFFASITNTSLSTSLNTNSKQSFNIDKLYKKQLDDKGRKVYKRKKNMKDLLDIMSDDSFQSFFDKNFQSWDDIRTVVILMAVLRRIDKYTEDKNLNKYQKLALLEMILSNSENRSLIYKYFTGRGNISDDSRDMTLS